MRLRRIWISLALLGVLLVGVLLGEIGVGSGVVNAAKVRFAGHRCYRLSLQDWEIRHPVLEPHGLPGEGRWVWDWSGNWMGLRHSLGLKGRSRPAFLFLDLWFDDWALDSLAEGELDFQLTVDLTYQDLGGLSTDRRTFTGQELAAHFEEESGLVELIVLPDDTRSLVSISLWVSGESLDEIPGLFIERVELLIC